MIVPLGRFKVWIDRRRSAALFRASGKRFMIPFTLSLHRAYFCCPVRLARPRPHRPELALVAGSRSRGASVRFLDGNLTSRLQKELFKVTSAQQGGDDER